MENQEHEDRVEELVNCMVSSLKGDIRFPHLCDAILQIACNLVSQASKISVPDAEEWVRNFTCELNRSITNGTRQ